MSGPAVGGPARGSGGGPVVHCLTNAVTAGLVADALAAIGAAPVMAAAPEEVAEVAARSDALLLNCGTPSAERFAALRSAATAARAAGIPAVLDPVGCGTSPWRTRLTRELAEASRPLVVRGNVAEIAALAGRAGPGLEGVRARAADPDAVEEIAVAASAALGTVVLATGRGTDVLAVGGRAVRLGVDAPALARVVGGGDVLSALVAAFAATRRDGFAAAEGAHGAFAVAAQAAGDRGPGSFWPAFLDALAAHG